MKKNKKTLGKVERTSAGFEIIKFQDRNGTECSLQVSSLADYEQPGVSAVWLGPVDAQPKIMAREAPAYGIKTEETTSWIPYPIPDAVFMTTRAHLSRENVTALISHLQSWLKNDTLKCTP